VLGTLVSSARSVFKVLAEHQLGDPGAGGASQALLFRMCRERFILNTEQVCGWVGGWVGGWVWVGG